MKFSESRGIKTQRWEANELLRNDDINRVGHLTYANYTDLLASIAYQKSVAEVISGLELTHSTAMTCVLSAGAAVSFDGPYLTSDGVWGFSADPGSPFSVVVPVDTNVAFDDGSGMSDPRIDTLEIRPVLTEYNQKARSFKDPVTGVVSSSLVDTSIEYGFEFQILKGTEAASPTAPASTAGWIKVAEVSVAVDQTELSDSDIITYQDASLWTTETSSVFYRFTTSATDTTAGRVMKVGDFGIGAFNTEESPISDLDLARESNVLPNGIYQLEGTESGLPDDWSGIGILVVDGYSPAFHRQMVVDRSVSPRTWYRVGRPGLWSDWQELYHSGNYPSDTAWTTVTSLDNGWTGTVRYIKRAGMVTVTAVIDGSGASDVTILTLPSDYRPEGQIDGSARSVDWCQILSGGDVNASIGQSNTRFFFTYPVL